jgi:hypothetical protein
LLIISEFTVFILTLLIRLETVLPMQIHGRQGSVPGFPIYDESIFKIEENPELTSKIY